MRYMHVGDIGASALAGALQADMIITELCLANARISSVGVSDLAASIGGDPENFSVNVESMAMVSELTVSAVAITFS